jgi:two-component system, OmpR family, sensor kinase
MKRTERRAPPDGPVRPARGGSPRRLLWNVPLGWQLSALYTLVLALTLALVGALVYRQQETFLVQDSSSRLALVARGVVARDPGAQPRDGHGGGPGASGGQGDHGGPSSPYIGSDRDPAAGGLESPATRGLIEDLIRGLSGPDITVAVRDLQGNVITSTQGLAGDASRIIDPVTPQQVSAATASGQPVSWLTRRADGSRQVVVLMPVTLTAGAGAGTPLLLEQSASLAAADTALKQLGAYLLLGVLLGTLAAVALGLAVTRVLLRPLDTVAGAAEAIAGGDLQRRLQLPAGRNEVARLGKAFDYMVGRLVTALEAQRRFVADASHELRTPLTSLKGLTEILMIGAHGNDTRVIEQSAGAIHEELDRLIRLVNDLLTLSRLDSAGDAAAPPIRRARIDACVTLQAAAGQMAALAGARGVRLTNECAEPLWIDGDAGALKQVLLNLLDNGLRHTPAGGQVTLRGRREATSARIEVQDTGAGIAPGDLPKIFDRFYRGDVSRTRATGNSGLGLAIVRSIVEAHDGTIMAESAPGAGACFIIRLPLASEPAAAAAPGRAASPSA